MTSRDATPTEGNGGSRPAAERIDRRLSRAMRLHPWRVGSFVIAGAILLTIVAQAQAPTANLVGYWSLNENGGSTAADSSGLNHGGNLVASPAWVAGKSGSALAFSGSSYVSIGDIPEIRGQSEVTMGAWIKRGSTNARVLIGKQTNGHDLAIEAWSDGRLYFGVSNGSYADGYVALNDTAWHHVTLVFNGRLTGNANRLKGYVDGVQSTLTFEGTIPATTTSNTTPFAIGKIQNDFSSGSVDEVRLYARALSLDEVRSLSDLGAPPPPPPPAPTVTSVAPPSGPTAGGTAVTISGTGFVSGASVSFGGSAATGVTVTNSTSISATTPAHTAGAVSVVVTNPGPLSGTCASCFTFVAPPPPPPAPTVSSVAPASGPAAGGTAVTITGSGFATGASATSVRFGATAATAVNCASTTSCGATSPAGSGLVDVTVTVGGLTSATSAADRFTYVNPGAPAPTVSSVAPASGPTAGGTAVTITGSGFTSGASVSFGGSAATNVSVTDANTLGATAPAHAAGAVNVVVINADGQSGTCASCFSYVVTASPVFPLAASASGRYLVDASGVPFRIHGEAAWSMIANLTYAEADAYLNDRKAKGFNTVLVNLLERSFAINAPANRNGDAPFNTPNNFSTPNEAYFAFADSLIDLAASKDMVVMLAYMYPGSSPNEGWSAAIGNATNTQSVSFNFGLYVGNRYKDRTNIIWVAGGDYSPSPGSEIELRLHKIMEGIKAASGASRLFTGHWSSDRVSTDQSAFAAAMNLNAVYSYATTYTETLSAYGFAPAIPTFLLETGYELEGWAPGDPAWLRSYAYGAYLSGIGGVFYGHRDIWEFSTNTWWSGYPFGHQAWQLSLNSPGALDMSRMDQLLDGLPWWNLVPSNVSGMKRIVTTGGGTFGNANYVTAAATPDGSTLLAYVPSTGTASRFITIDMTVMSGPSRARWFNPTTGGYVAIGTSLANVGTRQFTTPGDNGTGENDWVLVLDKM